MREWLFLTVAIVCEVFATSMLKSTEGFTRLWPSAFVFIGYCLSFFFLSLTLRTIPVGVAYAVWSGLGTTLIVLIAWLAMDQKLDFLSLAGIFLIISGVLILSLFSKFAMH